MVICLRLCGMVFGYFQIENLHFTVPVVSVVRYWIPLKLFL